MERIKKEKHIGLLEILESLWSGKWIILTTLFVAFAAAFFYVRSLEKVYRVSLEYSLDFCLSFTIETEVCDQNINNFIDSVLDPKWTMLKNRSSGNFIVYYETQDPNTFAEYKKEFEEYSKNIKLMIVNEGKTELTYINNVLGESFRSTDYSARMALSSELLVQKVSDSKDFIKLERLDISKSGPDTVLIIILIILLTEFITCAFIILRQALQKPE